VRRRRGRSGTRARRGRRRVATETVAILRSAAGRDPYNRELSDLVGELATQSEAFRTRWATHNVRFHNIGVKRFHHPVVGELSLSVNRLDLAADRLTLFTYTAEPGSRSEDALKLLGSHHRPRRAGACDRPELRLSSTCISLKASRSQVNCTTRT
jgi:hypothetical protein